MHNIKHDSIEQCSHSCLSRIILQMLKVLLNLNIVEVSHKSHCSFALWLGCQKNIELAITLFVTVEALNARVQELGFQIFFLLGFVSLEGK